MLSTAIIPLQPQVHAATGSRNLIDFGPYLQAVTKTNITVRWYTTTAGTTTVNYGLTSSYGSTASVAGTHQFHEVNITGLSVNTTYHYQVVTDDAQSADATFKTAINVGDTFDFLATGDTRTPGTYDHTNPQTVVNRMALYSGEFILNVGDIVYNGGQFSDWPGFFNDSKPVLNHTVYFPIRGNHDLGGTNYLDLFTLPNDNERWYSFDYGNVHFIGLDTNNAYHINGTVENSWFRSDLVNATNNSAIDFIIVYFHHPPYDSRGGDSTVRNALVPLFNEFRVDLVLCGHSHFYERSIVPPQNITYVVNGGGGAELVTASTTNPYQVKFESVFEFMQIKVRGKLMNWTAIRTDGSILDSFELDKRDLIPPIGVPLTATDTGLGNTIDLNWSGYNETKEGVKSYRVFMSQTPFTDTTAMSFLQEMGVGNKTLRLTNLTDYAQYYFAVVAEDLSGNRDPLVIPVTATPTDKDPPLPSGAPTVREVGFTNIRFDWNASPSNDVIGYLVFRNVTGAGAVPGGPYELLASVSNTTLQYNMTGLANGTQYRFIVKAFDDAIPPNNSTATTEANATTSIPNRAPQLMLQGTITMVEDQVLPGTFDVTSMFWDPDGDPMTYAATLADPGMIGNVTITLEGGTGLDVIASRDWNGAFDIVVTVTDGVLFNTGLVHLKVAAVNDPPVLHLKPEYNVFEGQAAEIRYEASDVDGDPLMFAHELPSDLDGLPEDILSIDDISRTLLVNATDAMIGTHSIMVTVSDGNDTVSGTFLLVVLNTNDPPDVPLIVSPRDGAIFEHGDHIDFVAQISDLDLLYGDKLKVMWYLDGNTTSFGEGLEVLSVKGIGDGDHEVTVVVTDMESLSNEASATFNVKPAEIPPVQNKTCPDGSIIPVDGTCPQDNTTGCPGKKGPDSFFGKGMAMDFAILGAMILATTAVLIAIYTHIRKGEGPGQSAPQPKNGPSKPEKGDEDEKDNPDDGKSEEGD